MLKQLLLGAMLISGSIFIHITAIRLIEDVLTPRMGWFVKPPFRQKVTIGLIWLVLCLMASHSVCVWVWAFAFLHLGAFDAMEPSVYFSIVTFTTVGYGDLVMTQEWRILGALCAATGMIVFGISTAVIIEFLVRIRRAQDQHKPLL